MSCRATSPINIIKTDSKCLNKCRLNYAFNKSSVNVKNQGNYVSIQLINNDSIVAEYSSANTPLCSNGEGSSRMTINELRIYSPSLHKFGSDAQNAAGELVIILNNTSGGRNLLICIPISTLNGTLPTAATNLNNIINYLASAGNSEDEGGTIKGLEIDLNNFISQKGYYTYTGTLPWDACESCNDLIVYDTNDTAIGLDNSTITLLRKLISTSNIPVIEIDNDEIGYAYNQRGAISGFGDGNDKIWINCYPTGSEGQVLIEQTNQENINNNSNSFDWSSPRGTATIIGLWVVGICVVMFGIVYGIGPALASMFSKSKISEIEMVPTNPPNSSKQ